MFEDNKNESSNIKKYIYIFKYFFLFAFFKKSSFDQTFSEVLLFYFF